MSTQPVAAEAAAGVLPRAFYARATLTVARDLIGKMVITARAGRRTAGRIVEVEAYLGPEDAASHAARGPTPRSRIMFGPAGRAYVYIIYGMHHCLNVVTEEEGTPGAVLIRALEPQEGQALMARRRSRARSDRRQGPGDSRDLCAGPGKLCQALGIDLAWNGLAFGGVGRAGRQIWLASGGGRSLQIEATQRIGVTRARRVPWRFVDRNSPCLSVRPAATKHAD